MSVTTDQLTIDRDNTLAFKTAEFLDRYVPRRLQQEALVALSSLILDAKRRTAAAVLGAGERVEERT